MKILGKSLINILQTASLVASQASSFAVLTVPSVFTLSSLQSTLQTNQAMIQTLNLETSPAGKDSSLRDLAQEMQEITSSQAEISVILSQPQALKPSFDFSNSKMFFQMAGPATKIPQTQNLALQQLETSLAANPPTNKTAETGSYNGVLAAGNQLSSVLSKIGKSAANLVKSSSLSVGRAPTSTTSNSTVVATKNAVSTITNTSISTKPQQASANLPPQAPSASSPETVAVPQVPTPALGSPSSGGSDSGHGHVATPTPTPSPTPAPVSSPTPTPVPSPEASPSPTPSPTPSPSPTPTTPENATPTPTATPIASPTPSVSSGPLPQTNSLYRLTTSCSSGKSLAVKSARVSAGSQIQGENFEAYNLAQQVYLVAGSEPNTYSIHFAHTEMAMDVYGGFYQEGTALIQWPFYNQENQIFRFIPQSNGYYKIQALHSGLYLSYGVRSGSSLTQEQSSTGCEQMFALRVPTDRLNLCPSSQSAQTPETLHLNAWNRLDSHQSELRSINRINEKAVLLSTYDLIHGGWTPKKKLELRSDFEWQDYDVDLPSSTMVYCPESADASVNSSTTAADKDADDCSHKSTSLFGFCPPANPF